MDNNKTNGFDDTTILVCGGAGFIGSNFINYIFSEYSRARIINLDLLTYCGNLDNLAGIPKDAPYIFVRGDIADKAFVTSIIRHYQPEYIINFAAHTHVDRSIHDNVDDFFHTNIQGTFVLLEVLRAHNASLKKFAQVSTDEVYGDLPLDSSERFSEKSALRPSSPYASTKAAGDLLCLSYFRTFGVPVVVTRCGNNYGPYQYPEKLIPFSILRIFENKKVPIYGDGLYVRDWIYVEDHCRALESCLLKGRGGEVYNIGAEMEKNNLLLAEIILKHFGYDASLVTFVPDRPGHDRRYALDTSRVRQELGWAPKYEFNEAFSRTIEWYLHNQQWIENIRRKGETFNAHLGQYL